MSLETVTHRHELVPFAVPEVGLPREPQDNARELADYPQHAIGVPPGVHRSGRYAVRFANNLDDLRAAQRLRFEVFNLELREGLTESYQTGLDCDEFDARCHHLLVIDETAGEVVGTYRLMTSDLAGRAALYTGTEFELAGIPDAVLRHGAEVGRACVAKEHRNGRVLQLLWRGIARYLDWNDKRYVFGCCSVPTLDAGEIAAITRKLVRDGHMHSRYYAEVRPALRAEVSDSPCSDARAEDEVEQHVSLPPLFVSYLRLGAKVCGGPACDREFCVTDYFVVLDLRDVEPRMLANLAAPGLWKSAC